MLGRLRKFASGKRPSADSGDASRLGDFGFAVVRLSKEFREIRSAAAGLSVCRIVVPPGGSGAPAAAPCAATVGTSHPPAAAAADLAGLSVVTVGGVQVAEMFLDISGAPETVYAGEAYQLRFRFPSSYPLDSPEVVFVGKPPIHPHVYSNGHICLSILYDEWSPALGISSICLSIISMLSSNKEKRRPEDDAQYTSRCGNHISPKQMRWVFHDDKA